MNQWNVVLKEYFSSSTKIQIFREMWRQSNWMTIIGVALVLLAVILAGFIAYFSEKHWVSIIILICTEVVFIKILDDTRYKVFTTYYSDKDESTDVRYNFFRDGLVKYNVKKTDVSDCFELVDMKLEISEKSNTNLRKTVSYLLAVFAGFLAATAKNLPAADVIWVIFVFGVISFFVICIASVIPTRSEKLLELKYFMKLFLADPRNN